MNPPSALHGAMSRDRKPFTYTPGGLDLSEIKSERMAKRLMRNAMNEGVPQTPVQQIQSPPATTIAVPNFNCLPVQVFPTFNLPANPKSLLRTRSNPVSREPPLLKEESQFVNKPIQRYDTFSKNTPLVSQINNNKPTSAFETSSKYMSYGSNLPSSMPVEYAPLPEISYDAKYYQTSKINATEQPTPLISLKNTTTIDNSELNNKEVSFSLNNDVLCNDLESTNVKEDLFTNKTDRTTENKQIYNEDSFKPSIAIAQEPIIEVKPEIALTEEKPQEMVVSIPETLSPELLGYSDEKKQVKIVTKTESKKQSKSEKQNGEKNDDTEGVLIIGPPPLAVSSAKTATKIEITKNTLPDGSVEEVKKTITTTTIDGKTSIKTKTETTIIPKDDEEEEEVEEEEEEEETQESDEKPVTVTIKADKVVAESKENSKSNIIKNEERSETTTTTVKKVVVVQNDDEEEVEQEDETQEEEIEEAEPVTVVLKKPAPPKVEEAEITEIDVEEKKDEEKAIIQEIKQEEIVVEDAKVDTEYEKEQPQVSQEVEEEEVEEVEEEEEYEEVEDTEIQNKQESESNTKKDESEDKSIQEDEAVKDETLTTQEEKEEVETEEDLAPVEETSPVEKSEPVEVEIPILKESDDKQEQEVTVEKVEQLKTEVTEETKTENIKISEPKVPLREPSVPLEKVEEVEIKPIGAGNIIRKTSTETTEIITGVPDKPTGLLTEFNRTENIVTVNRTTKTLEYENAQSQLPPLTYFTPHIEKFPPPPQPANRPYQPVYSSEPTTERRHSLLLDRLSVERQIPTNDIYQNTQQYTQTIEQQNQWDQEPRVEILAVENVKPSSITNQQWYQQSEKKDVIYNNVAQAPPTTPSWNPPKQQQPVYEPPSQPAYQPPIQPAYQPQPSYQAPMPQYQPPQPKPVYQSQTQYQPQTPTPQYQYSENIQNTTTQQNSYTNQQYSYTPKPTYTPSTQTQYTSDYQTQKLSSSYVPPPWEQDSTYVVDNSQNYFQPSQTNFSPDVNQSWQPTPPASKFNKTTTTAYIPPKPNQSFVKHVTISEPPKQPGRKTYYSEYERRYISVPESTYIPGETKPQQPTIQVQPDASPAYYYDNNEPAEQVEHQWRKELREFTEKSQTQPENVQPPWEAQHKTQSQYSKTQETTYSSTPSWSQTLRPQSWRERSFESEFVSQEWPKTNTLGRGRPLSSYGQETVIPERTRGVSVDRYNPNSYQSPVPEPHPPVQTFTHNPPAPHGPGYHNPNVPAYHSRASAEPREQPVYQQPRSRVDSRASPFQSRSFKYLQWITGTED